MTAARKAERAPALPLPHRFGTSYVLFDRIGQGGMAEIYLARGITQIGAARLAVVKLVLPELAADPKFSQMLVAEAKLAAELSHTNVVRTYDLGREEGRLYIAMEYVEGFDLNELLRRCSKARLPFPAEFALFIVGETLRALEYAHKKKDAEGHPLGIVHRDVSPSNVLISFEGEVKLCDFGIARAMNDKNVELDEETIEGKAAYMSPEHAKGDAIDARSDVFSASVILWELLGGRRMYKATPGRDALELARRAEVPPLPELGLPEHARIAAIIAKGLAKDPNDRYPNALAMARDLDDYVMATRLRASPLKVGDFILDHFGEEVLAVRRARERAAEAMEQRAQSAAPEGSGVGVVPSVGPPESSAVRPRSNPGAAASAPEPDAEFPTEPRASTKPSEMPTVQLPAGNALATGAGVEVPSVVRAGERKPATRPAGSGSLVARAVAGGLVIAVLAAALGYALAHR